MPKTIQHDAHKNHPLVLRGSGSFDCDCDGCGCAGTGPRYRCDACHFDLHELCATAPSTARFFFHRQHPLTFEPATDHNCDLCDTPIVGMHYRCVPCGFDVHPVCSQLPGAAVSPLHPEHLMMLTVDAPDECERCGELCYWRYRCGVCRVDLHPMCLLGTEKTPLNIPRNED